MTLPKEETVQRKSPKLVYWCMTLSHIVRSRIFIPCVGSNSMFSDLVNVNDIDLVIYMDLALLLVCAESLCQNG